MVQLENVLKVMKILMLLNKVDDDLVRKFFDVDSEKMLDVKIDVLTKLAHGTPPTDIPQYYDILELMPKDNTLWD
jgi:hypothetical protein